jgi:hypothetical protein
VSKDGAKTDILATGFRAPNGVCLNPDGTFFLTDQEGHWMPKNRINWVRPGRFYGNMWGFHDVTDSSDSAMTPPVCWITNAFDRSPSELLWVDSKDWRELNGGLLNLSYGFGKVFLVLREAMGDAMQGGMVALPIPQFPTGIMRGRFHPMNGALYVCGMFAWAGNQTQPGGLFRIRRTQRPLCVPVGLSATTRGVVLEFSEPLDPAAARDPVNYAVKAWSIRRSKEYGSPHINERSLTVRGVELAADGRSVLVDVADLAPTPCMEIKYKLRSQKQERVDGAIHHTIHRLADR